MDAQAWDMIVLGQGLAGSAVAWTAQESGRRVLLIDRPATNTSSRVAAGLMTPITGQRLVPAWRWSEFWPFAHAFYRRVEAWTGVSCFHERTMARLFADATEQLVAQKRWTEAVFRDLMTSESVTGFDAPFGGFEMTGGQLDVPAYLDATRRWWSARGQFQEIELHLPGDFVLKDGIVTIPRLHASTALLVCCQGIDAVANPWFSRVAFKPAKGEILTLSISGWSESRVIHRGMWLAPADNGCYRAGATYDWDHLDGVPTADARRQIEAGLATFLRRPYHVVDHQAAVRPIHRNQYPVLGRHPDFPQLAYLNGLGSKGSLQAPLLAQWLMQTLETGASPHREIDLHRRTDLRGCHP